jgi:HEAT repeat protein
MPKLGADAISPVVEVLRAGMKADEDSNLPVLILYDIGRPAQPAVPVLLELLERPGKTSRYYICAALRTAGDPQAVPAIRPLLSWGDIQTAVEAAGALAAMGDKQSFVAIAALAPKVEAGRSDELHDLLSALWRMDAQKAVPIVERYLNDPAWAKSRDFIKPANYDPQ